MRMDLEVYNEATGFTIHPRDLQGMSREEVTRDWNTAVLRGCMMPISLIADCELTVRVVVAEGLQPQEEDEWIGRLTWWLSIPDGRLTVEGGWTGVDTPHAETFTSHVEAPSGDYTAAVYTYLHGVNGAHCLHDAGNQEPLRAWHGRTRPGVVPAACLYEIIEENDCDHGIEDPLPWDMPEDETPFIDFLIHLQPLERRPAESPALTEGWFPATVGARKPEIFPLGIPARLG